MKPTIVKSPLNRLLQVDLAALFAVTDRTIRNWDNEGLPGTGEGRARRYDWPLVLAWYVARVSGPASGSDLSDKEREQKAKADIAEMEAYAMAGKTLDRAEAIAGWQAFLGRLKESIRGISLRVAPRLEDGMLVGEREAVIQKEIDQTLRDVVEELARTEEAA